jgi:hypothetical protein
MNGNGDVPEFETGIAETPDALTAYDEMVMAMIPVHDNPNKQEYLCNRAVGFSVRESAAMAGVRQATVMKWRRDDEEFAQWESGGLHVLQAHLGPTLLRLQYMRCMRLTMAIDFRRLRQNFLNPNSQSEMEKLQTLAAQKRYDGKGLSALQEAVGDEAPKPPLLPGETRAELTLKVEGRAVDAKVAEQEAYRQLLDNFTTTKKYLGDGQEDEEEPIEGEVVGSSD